MSTPSPNEAEKEPSLEDQVHAVTEQENQAIAAIRQLFNNFRGLAIERARLTSKLAEMEKDANTWRHVLEMVRANGFESVGQVLVKVDSLRQELEMRGEG